MAGRKRSRAVPPITTAPVIVEAPPFLARLRLRPLPHAADVGRIDVTGYMFGDRSQVPSGTVDITADMVLTVRERTTAALICPFCSVRLADPASEDVRDGESIGATCHGCGETVEIEVDVPEPVFTVASGQGRPR